MTEGKLTRTAMGKALKSRFRKGRAQFPALKTYGNFQRRGSGKRRSLKNKRGENRMPSEEGKKNDELRTGLEKETEKKGQKGG